MAALTTDVRFVKGIGEGRAKSLNKLGIITLRDLISFSLLILILLIRPAGLFGVDVQEKA